MIQISTQLLVLGWAAGSAMGQPNWPEFRGPDGRGVSMTARPPIEFGTSKAIWATEVPPGHSSPVIWKDQIFLTTFEEGKLECRAYHRSNGKLAWSRQVKAEKIEQTHAFNNPAAPTAAADAKLVVFYFGSYGLLAFKHDGSLAWEKKLPAQISRGKYGSASSPVLCGELVIQTLDTDEGGSRVLALKRATGETAWETERPLFSAGWSTPIVWRKGGKSQVVVLGSKKLVAYDSADGKELWSVPGFPVETAPSLAWNDEMVFACSAAIGGRSGPKWEGSNWDDLLKFDSNKDGKIQFSEIPEDYRMVLRAELPEGHPGRVFPVPLKRMIEGLDQDKDGAVSKEEWDAGIAMFERMDGPVLMALKPGVAASDSDKRVAWQISRGIPEVPSPVCYEGKVFLVRDGGLVECVSATSGSILYQERLGKGGGYTASPIAAEGRIYLASQSGTISVIDGRSEQLKVLAQNALGETITATPAMVENKLYVRTDKHLFAFGTK